MKNKPFEIQLKKDSVSFQVCIEILTVSGESTDTLRNPDTKPVADLVHHNILQKAKPEDAASARHHNVSLITHNAQWLDASALPAALQGVGRGRGITKITFHQNSIRYLRI